VSEPDVTGARRGRIDRARRWATTRVTGATAALESARQRSRPVEAAVRTYERDRDAAGAVLAGAVAFRLFVFMLPLTLGVVTLLGTLRAVDTGAPGEVGRELGMSSYLVDSVEDAARQSRKALWVLVPVSLWAIYTGGRGVIKVLTAVHAIAWRRPMTRPRVGVAAALAALGLALAALLVLAGLQAVRSHAEGPGLALGLLGFVPFCAVWLAAALLLPHDPRARWPALVPGSLLVGVAAWAVHLVSVYILAHQVERASELYGSLGVAAALLAWLYLLGRVMVASAMLNATNWELRHPAEAPRSAPGRWAAGPAGAAPEPATGPGRRGPRR
jgi:uncharacterized BrkB/YihY/UPF0761 family membrane protein